MAMTHAHIARLSTSDKPVAYYRRGDRERNPTDERTGEIEMNRHTRRLPFTPLPIKRSLHPDRPHAVRGLQEGG
jgi:hypothetical protein